MQYIRDQHFDRLQTSVWQQDNSTAVKRGMTFSSTVLQCRRQYFSRPKPLFILSVLSSFVLRSVFPL